eukprot:6483229-Amphidinium_carterae.1
MALALIKDWNILPMTSAHRALPLRADHVTCYKSLGIQSLAILVAPSLVAAFCLTISPLFRLRS